MARALTLRADEPPDGAPPPQATGGAQAPVAGMLEKAKAPSGRAAADKVEALLVRTRPPAISFRPNLIRACWLAAHSARPLCHVPADRRAIIRSFVR